MVIEYIDGADKGTDKTIDVLTATEIAVAQLQQIETDLIRAWKVVGQLLKPDRLLQIPAGIGELMHAILDGLVKDSGLDGLQDVLQTGTHVCELCLQSLLPAVVTRLGNRFVIAGDDPVDQLIMEQLVPDGLGYGALYWISRKVRHVAGVIITVPVTGVIAELAAILPDAAQGAHRRAAPAAEEFAGEQVFAVTALFAARELLVFQYCLHLLEHILRDDGRDAALDAHVTEFVDADIKLVAQQRLETLRLPLATQTGLDPTVIQICLDIGDGPAVDDPLVDLPDDGGRGVVDGEGAIRGFLIAERDPSVDLAFMRIVHHATQDVLSHVLRIELVDIHHVPEGKTPGGGVVEVLFHIDTFDAEIRQLRLVDHSLQHVPTNAVGLPGNDEIKTALVGVLHHPLKLGAVVRLAGYGSVRILTDDGEAVDHSVLAAGVKLLLDGHVPLVVGGVPGVDHRTTE